MTEPAPYKKTRINSTRRLMCFKRDGFKCQRCGLRPKLNSGANDDPKNYDLDQLQVHHVLPYTRGGGNEKGNLITLCKPCHRGWHGVEKEWPRITTAQYLGLFEKYLRRVSKMNLSPK